MRQGAEKAERKGEFFSPLPVSSHRQASLVWLRSDNKHYNSQFASSLSSFYPTRPNLARYNMAFLNVVLSLLSLLQHPANSSIGSRAGLAYKQGHARYHEQQCHGGLDCTAYHPTASTRSSRTRILRLLQSASDKTKGNISQLNPQPRLVLGFCSASSPSNPSAGSSCFAKLRQESGGCLECHRRK